MSLISKPLDNHRYLLGNDHLRLQFDLRTSDTMYNYVWIKNHKTNEFERLHNFGADVWSRLRNGEERNTIGINLQLTPTTTDQEVSVKVIYPQPLALYRQFEKAPDLAAIHNYPSLPNPLPEKLLYADAALAVHYSIKKDEPAFTTWGYHLVGHINSITPIFNAMWVDNPDIPTTFYLEDFGEWDSNIRRRIREINITDIRYAVFYNKDGRGLPYACVFTGRQTLLFMPHPGNPTGGDGGVFYMCSTNQDFIPNAPCIHGFNDTNIRCMLESTKITPPIKWIVFPELANGLGGTGKELLARICKTIEEKHLDWWQSATRDPQAEFFLHDPK